MPSKTKQDRSPVIKEFTKIHDEHTVKLLGTIQNKITKMLGLLK